MLSTFKIASLVVVILLTLTATGLYGQDTYLITEVEDFATRASMEYLAAISKHENPKTGISEPLKGTTVMKSQIPNRYLLDAGRNLKISAVLRYVGFGLVSVSLIDLGHSLSNDESILGLDLSSTLALGGTTLSLVPSNFAIPFFIGRAGEELAVHPEGPIQEAGIALQKYRKHYYRGVLSSIAGSGILIWGISKESNPGIATGAILTLASVLYTTIAPPYYLGSAGSSLRETDNLHMQKAGRYLEVARENQYSALIISALGGIIAVSGIYRDEDTGIYGAGIALGLAAISNLVSSTRVHAASMELNQAAGTMR